MKPLEFILQSHVHQHGKCSSGLACLISIVKYHKGEVMQDQLRYLSGTNPLGTTVLGLYQAAGKVGFDAEGFKGTMNDLKSVNNPVILDVTMDNTLRHFLVCYGFDGQFLIGDPAWGVTQYCEEELNAVWKSKTLLKLVPNDLFLKTEVKFKRNRKWIGDLLKSDLHILLVVAVLDVIVSFFAFAPVIIIQQITDSLLRSQNTGNLFRAIILFGILWAIRNCFAYIKGITTAIQRREFKNRISIDYESRLINLSRSFFESFNMEKLMAWRNDIRSISACFGFIMENLLINALVIVISLGVIFFYSTSLGFLALASVAFYGFLGMRITNGIADLEQECTGLHNQNESNYVNDQRLLSLIKESNKEKMFSKIARDTDQLLQDKIYSLEILVNQKKTKLNFAQLILLAPIVLIISFMFSDQKLTIGEVIAVSILMLSIYSAAKILIMLRVQVQKSKVILDRMFEFAMLETEYSVKKSEKKLDQDSEEFCLVAQDISFRFTGNRPLFKNVSFSVKRGELIVIFGEAGSGKSTISKILQRVVDVESGDIIFNQKDWKELDVREWRQKIAVVSQNVTLMNTTLIENLCFENLTEEAVHVMEFCKKYHFDQYFESLPQGYLTLVGEDGTNLSAGQRQLVAVARALYRKPKLLLLDEATNFMDRKMEAFIMNLLNSVKENIAVVLITNSLPIPGADCIYLLDKGEMKFHGTHEDLVQYKNCYSKYFPEKDLEI